MVSWRIKCQMTKPLIHRYIPIHSFLPALLGPCMRGGWPPGTSQHCQRPRGITSCRQPHGTTTHCTVCQHTPRSRQPEHSTATYRTCCLFVLQPLTSWLTNAVAHAVEADTLMQNTA